MFHSSYSWFVIDNSDFVYLYRPTHDDMSLFDVAVAHTLELHKETNDVKLKLKPEILI